MILCRHRVPRCRWVWLSTPNTSVRAVNVSTSHYTSTSIPRRWGATRPPLVKCCSNAVTSKYARRESTIAPFCLFHVSCLLAVRSRKLGILALPGLCCRSSPRPCGVVCMEGAKIWTTSVSPRQERKTRRLPCPFFLPRDCTWDCGVHAGRACMYRHSCSSRPALTPTFRVSSSGRRAR